MHDVNWWLMLLAFALGMVVTFLTTVRKVTREVPVGHTLTAGLSGKASAGSASASVDLPDGDLPSAKLTGGAVAAGGGVAAKLTGGKLDAPYGSGSIRLAAGAAAPSGYTIKGNEDSMLYHTTESPWYKQTIAEVWFNAESVAQKAGFTRWDAERSGIAKFADVPPGPYGKGSAKAGDGGSGPTGWTIKGNEDSMLYHTTESPWYKQTIAEVWFAEEDFAQKAGFTRWDAERDGVAKIADVPAGAYGKGSATPAKDGSGPAGWLIKGNADSMLYHGTDSPAYDVTIAEVWFFDEATAKKAGFDKWDKNFK